MAAHNAGKISIFWDLDNKPPRYPPHQVALNLKAAASAFGPLVEVLAFANLHAFTHVPKWSSPHLHHHLPLNPNLHLPSNPNLHLLTNPNLSTNPDLLHINPNFLEIPNSSTNPTFIRNPTFSQDPHASTNPNPSSTDLNFSQNSILSTPKRDLSLIHNPPICPLCGLTFPAKSQLKRHRRIHHNGERGHKKATLAGYGLGLELVKAGFDVRTVDKSSQAADRAMKKRMRHAMENGLDWICIVSDDSGFSEMLMRGRERGIGIVVIGDTPSLRICSDFWLAWDDVAQGKLLSASHEHNLISSDTYRDGFMIECSHENVAKFDGIVKNVTKLSEIENGAESTKPGSGKTDKHRAFYDFSSDFSAEDEEEEDELTEEYE